jgi:hydrogenase/urease accessory protein HupE
MRLLAWIGWAWAHTAGLSTLDLDGDALVWTLSAAEVQVLRPGQDPQAAAPELVADTTLSTASGPCTLGPRVVSAVQGDGIEVRAAVVCPQAGDWTVDAAYVRGFGAGHRIAFSVDGRPVAGLYGGATATTFRGAPGLWETARLYGMLGVEHILTGYDHLAFVAGLLLGARGVRSLLVLVTTFTLAHSVTLAAATLGWLSAPSAVVEPLIAASIAFVGLENLWHPPLARRVALTFAFGLVHGLGFAGLLAELGVGRASLPWALLSFNLGVEAGQLAAVAVAGWLVHVASRSETWSTTGWRSANAGLTAAGLWWLGERLLGG